MIPRAIPRLGRTVMPLGFGGRGLDRDRQRVLLTALEHGVDVVDVSPAWGDSESLAGESIRELRARDRVLLCTHALPDRASLQRSIEGSLRATRLDVLPLVLLSPYADSLLTHRDHPELLDLLDRLIKEGKVLAWGASCPEPRISLPSLPAPITTLHLPLHIADRRAAFILPEATDAGLAVLAYRILDGGLFDADTGLSFALASGISTALLGTSSADHLLHALRSVAPPPS